MDGFVEFGVVAGGGIVEGGFGPVVGDEEFALGGVGAFEESESAKIG